VALNIHCFDRAGRGTYLSQFRPTKRKGFPMVRTTAGRGTGRIDWRRPEGARAVAQTRWFHDGARPDDTAERPTFLQLLIPLVALSLGAVFAIALGAVALFALLSLVI
jgi:hypothetical protein